MRTVLYLTSAGAQLWRKRRAGWQAHDGAPNGPVWVVTDLAEESFDELQIPRIFGRDRQGFIARQLANHFPDTPFRTTLPIHPGGSLMDRIAPPRQTLLGLDAAPRVNAALDGLTAPMAGVWAMSMLLAHIGCKKSLPPELFVVLPGAHALRIVFIKNWVPVLSRLIPGVTQAADQVAEISRTLRHLENTRVLERTVQRHAILVLGDVQGLATLLAADRLDLLAPPAPWNTLPPADWLFALFDLALTSPAGQLAPLSRRTRFIASRLRTPAYVGAALCLGLALLAAADNLRNIAANYSNWSHIQDQIKLLNTQVSEVDQKMAGFGEPAERVRSAVALDDEEVVSAPSLPLQMHQIAEVIGQHEAIRLQQFDWHLLSVGQAACAQGVTSPSASPPAPVTTAAAGPKRVVEISFEVLLPSDQREKARAQTMASLSSRLSKIEGATLIRDPAKELAQAVLSGGATHEQASSAKALTWCLTLPGTPTAAQASSPASTNPAAQKSQP